MDNNHHIKEYLNRYCALPSPKYAVLLTGKWGCGKTWFIKKYIAGRKRQRQRKKYYYVSLYGLTAFKEVDDKIYSQIKAPKGNPYLEEVIIPKGAVLVFDDLERCSISLHNLFAYFSGHLENSYKVVLICHEKELKKKTFPRYSNSATSYKNFKEKVVGKTLKVATNFTQAIQSFTEGSFKQDSPIQKAVLDNIENIKTVFNESQSNNLRVLFYALKDFGDLTHSFPDKIWNKKEAVSDFLCTYLALAFEVLTGKINHQNINNMSHWPNVFKEDAEGNSPPNKADKLFRKYRILELNRTITLGNGNNNGNSIWANIFSDESTNVEAVITALLNCSYFDHKNTPNWIKFWRSTEGFLEDAAFNELYEQVIQEWNDKTYTALGAVIHTGQTLFTYAKAGVINKESDDVIQKTKDYILYLKENSYIDSELYEKGSFDRAQYKGLGYRSSNDKEFEEFKEIFDYVDAQLKDIPDAEKENAASKVLEMMINDSDGLYDYLTPSSINQTSVLMLIDKTRFVETLLTASNQAKKVIIHAISHRYGRIANNPNMFRPLLDELPWIESVKSLIEAKVNNRRDKLSSYVLSKNIELYLDPLITQHQQLLDEAKKNAL